MDNLGSRQHHLWGTHSGQRILALMRNSDVAISGIGTLLRTRFAYTGKPIISAYIRINLYNYN